MTTKPQKSFIRDQKISSIQMEYDNSETVALMISIINSYNSSEIKTFFQAHIDPFIKDKNSNTPLHFIIALDNSKFTQQQKIDIIDMLLAPPYNFYVDATNISLETPLHIAIKNQLQHVVTFLLNHGAEVNKKNTFNQNALHLACIPNIRNIDDIKIEPLIKSDDSDKNKLYVDILESLIIDDTYINTLTSYFKRIPAFYEEKLKYMNQLNKDPITLAVDNIKNAIIKKISERKSDSIDLQKEVASQIIKTIPQISKIYTDFAKKANIEIDVYKRENVNINDDDNLTITTKILQNVNIKEKKQIIVSLLKNEIQTMFYEIIPSHEFKNEPYKEIKAIFIDDKFNNKLDENYLYIAHIDEQDYTNIINNAKHDPDLYELLNYNKQYIIFANSPINQCIFIHLYMSSLYKQASNNITVTNITDYYNSLIGNYNNNMMYESIDNNKLCNITNAYIRSLSNNFDSNKLKINKLFLLAENDDYRFNTYRLYSLANLDNYNDKINISIEKQIDLLNLWLSLDNIDDADIINGKNFRSNELLEQFGIYNQQIITRSEEELISHNFFDQLDDNIVNELSKKVKEIGNGINSYEWEQESNNAIDTIDLYIKLPDIQSPTLVTNISFDPKKSMEKIFDNVIQQYQPKYPVTISEIKNLNLTPNIIDSNKYLAEDLDILDIVKKEFITVLSENINYVNILEKITNSFKKIGFDDNNIKLQTVTILIQILDKMFINTMKFINDSNAINIILHQLMTDKTPGNQILLKILDEIKPTLKLDKPLILTKTKTSLSEIDEIVNKTIFDDKEKWQPLVYYDKEFTNIQPLGKEKLYLYNNPQIIKSIYEKHADYLTYDNSRLTPIEYAIQSGNYPVVSVLNDRRTELKETAYTILKNINKLFDKNGVTTKFYNDILENYIQVKLKNMAELGRNLPKNYETIYNIVAEKINNTIINKGSSKKTRNKIKNMVNIINQRYDTTLMVGTKENIYYKIFIESGTELLAQILNKFYPQVISKLIISSNELNIKQTNGKDILKTILDSIKSPIANLRDYVRQTYGIKKDSTDTISQTNIIDVLVTELMQQLTINNIITLESKTYDAMIQSINPYFVTLLTETLNINRVMFDNTCKLIVNYYYALQTIKALNIS